MKEKAKEKGLRLLQKGKRKLVGVIFSRTGIITALLILDIFLLFSIQVWISDLIPTPIVGFVVISFIVTMVVYLINSQMDPTSKITWLMLISLAPTLGAPLYFYVNADWGHRVLKRRLEQILEKTKKVLSQRESSLSKLKEQNGGEASLAYYLQSVGCHPVFDQCKLKYFPSGESKFQELKKQLEAAEEFIFMEYFIVDEGRMWGEVLEILAEKAKQGVEVRVMYDGSCEFTTLPRSYPQMLKKLGIMCKVFSPAMPFVSTHYNYRDHRKIAVIDGKVAFTGGVNLADEYINDIVRFGHWKDAALMIEGEAARSFALMFLQMWDINDRIRDTEKYITATAPRFEHEKGFVIPFADAPLDNQHVGEQVYIDILNRATSYVHIMTPYLILDGEMENALCFAARRGVDVKLIMPGIPDKKIPYALAKTYYRKLMAAGVKIYEYLPGFVHSKVFVSDAVRGVVGTINLDYRSLYHHFECAAYLYDCDCLADMEQDFQTALEDCVLVTENMISNRPPIQKLTGWLVKVIAPLF